MIAGEAKGRRLIAPRTSVTRPATDRLRESVFGTLGESTEDAAVLDLFAGSGAFGIEALSRGASRATFVDRDAAAIAAIRENLLSTGFVDRGRVARADVAAFVRMSAERYDLVFVDPPYAETELLAALLSGEDLRRLTEGVLVTRALRKHAPPVPAHWKLERERSVGEDLVRYLR